MSYGSFRAAHVAVQEFISDELLGAALTSEAPQILNISDRFATFLQNNDFNRLTANEEAQRQETLILRHLGQELEEWRALGVPAPIEYVENNANMLITWRHDLFRRGLGVNLTEQLSHFVVIYDWLLSLAEREFLFACALLLKCLGCNPIYISDGSGDMGVDCMGKIAEGPLRSLVVFVQSKTVQKPGDRVTENILRQEYSKYAMLKRSEKYLEYLNKLSVFDSRNGFGEVYFVLTNTEFGSSAQKAANRLGIILRAKRQLAYQFSLRASYSEILQAYEQFEVPSGPALDRNIAEEINV